MGVRDSVFGAAADIRGSDWILRKMQIQQDEIRLAFDAVEVFHNPVY
jgi:hypothetical protein